MKLTLQLFGILAFTSLFLSCEGSTTRERRITNNSSTSIHVVADGANLSNYNKSITPSVNKGFFTGHMKNYGELIIFEKKIQLWNENY